MSAQRAQTELQMKSDELEMVRVGRMTYVRDHRGLLIPVPAGGDENDEGDDDQRSSEGSDDDDDDSDEGDAGSDGDAKKDDGAAISRKEYEKVLERMRASDRNNSELQKKLREYEDKDKSESERLERDLNEALETNQTVASERDQLRLENAIMRQAGNRFRDLSDVVRFVDLTDLQDEDGKVDDKKVKSALDDLAKTKSYLLAEDGDGSDEGDQSGSNNGSSGTSMNRDKNKGKGIDRETLAKKYPALRR